MEMRTFPVFIICSLLLCSCENKDYEINSDNIPAASGVQIAQWNSATRLSFGIRGYDPVNNTPKDKCHDHWCLYVPRKQNLAGLLNRYGTYMESTGGYGDNAVYDWNLMIHCFNEYTGIYNSIKQTYYDPDEWHGCITPGQPCGTQYTRDPCMWAEIAPDNSFSTNNQWFPVSSTRCVQGNFLSKGDTVGVYGCYVTDDDHGNQPEIHPAQQIWFRNKTTNDRGSFWLMFIQDASDRFSSWVRSPIYGQFHIAFKVKPGRINDALFDPLTMNITIAKQLDLVTTEYADHRKDCDDGSSHSLVVNGQRLLVVNEPQAPVEDNKLGIQFIELAKLTDGSIQGYVQVSMVLGDYNTDPIGVCVLGLEVIPSKSTVGDNTNNLPVSDSL